MDRMTTPMVVKETLEGQLRWFLADWYHWATGTHKPNDPFTGYGLCIELEYWHKWNTEQGNFTPFGSYQLFELRRELRNLLHIEFPHEKCFPFNDGDTRNYYIEVPHSYRNQERITFCKRHMLT